MSRLIPIVLAVVVVAGLAAYFFLVPHAPSDFGTVAPSALQTSATYDGPPLSNPYKNEEFKFALSMPDGFKAQELEKDSNGASTIIFQNSKGEGIQVLVTPFSEDLKVLTKERIESEIPDMKVEKSEEVQIGAEYRGIAFFSDNEAFEGSSREVWFVFRGNLYQISTYARLDGLLKAMFATWRFL